MEMRKRQPWVADWQRVPHGEGPGKDVTPPSWVTHNSSDDKHIRASSEPHFPKVTQIKSDKRGI